MRCFIRGKWGYTEYTKQLPVLFSGYDASVTLDPYYVGNKIGRVLSCLLISYGCCKIIFSPSQITLINCVRYIVYSPYVNRNKYWRVFSLCTISTDIVLI